MTKVGITTTVPVEIIYAAGMTPVDLNNIFISSTSPQKMVEEAEVAGYPRNVCAWIKGIYSTVLNSNDINILIAVTQGDCSNTHALMETLELAGVDVVPFSYPFDRDTDLLALQMEKLMQYFGVTWNEVYRQKERLDNIREKIHRLDELSWKDDRITGWENHLYQICCSDFEGDPEEFEKQVEDFLDRLKNRKTMNTTVRLGYIGVPPIIYDLYEYLEEHGAKVVYNETQRQFTMPFSTSDIVEQYRLYTYPYGIFYRLEDIKKECEKRSLDGIIHYAQSFCYRHIEDLIIREKLDVPVLTLEADKPSRLDARTKMRLDAFIEMLR